MSYYEALPIYKAAMDTIVLLERVTQRFPKRHKYALGARLIDTATDCVLWIARAQRKAGRAVALDRLCDRVEELRLLVQIGKGLRARARYGARFVTPHQRAPGLACQLVQQGLRVALAVERPWPHGPLKRREVRWLLEPAPAGASPGECT